MLGVALLIAAFAAALIPITKSHSRIAAGDQMEHAELAAVPGGTVVGDGSE
jgi:hypothetical protein